MATIGRKRKIEETSIDAEDNSIEEPQQKKVKFEDEESETQVKMEIETEGEEATGISLPPEIMISIFERLAREDLARAAMACQEWKSYSRDPLFSWVTCHTVRAEYIWNAPTAPNPKLHKVRIEDIEVKKVTKGGYWRRGGGFTAPTEHDEYSYRITFTDGNGKVLDYQPKVINLDSPLPTTKDHEADPGLIRYYWHTDHTVEFEVNIRRLENLIERGEPPRWIGIVLTAVKNISFSLTHKLFKKNDFKAAFIPMPDPEKVTVKGFAKKLKLHDYQQRAISWMNYIEKAADDEVDYVRLVPWKGVATDLLFETELNRVCCAKDIPEFTKQMSHKGGILADEMGLGKTVEVMGLILSNPCTTLEEVSDSFVSKATLVVCPNHLTKQWVDEITKHTSPALKTHLITTMAELKAVTYGNLCDADVVVVSTSFLKNPNYFFHEAPNRSSGMGQGCNEARMAWVEKAYKRVSGKKNWRDEPSPVLDLFHWHRLVLDEGHETLNDELLDSIVWKYSSTYTWYVTGTPFPDQQLLERVPILLGLATELPGNQMEYYDMGVKQDYMINNLLWRNLKANITTQYDVPDLVTEEIKLKFTSAEAAIYQYMKNSQARHSRYYYSMDRTEDSFRKFCDGILRVAKTLAEERREYIYSCQGNLNSVNQEHSSNIKQKEKYENNTPEELAKMGEWQREYRLKFLETFEEKQVKLVEKRILFEKLLEQLKASRSPAEEAEEKAANDLPSTPPLNTENETKDEIKNNNNENNKAEDKADEEMSKNEQDESMQEEKESSVRKSSRAKRGAKAQKEAPPPKKKAAPAAGAKKGRGKKKAEQSEDKDTSTTAATSGDQTDPNKVRLYKSKLTAEEELPLIIERRGTKLGNLVIYLRKLFTFQKKARVIIFSQFSDMLSTIEELLGKCGIECAFVEGSVFKKNKALGSFKAGNTKTKVILLSLEKAASGTNLVEASHVIFMEPMQGSKQEIDAYEAQAIGRAHRQGQKHKVTIVRFYIENTIEEDMHNERKGIRKAPQVRTKSGLLVRTTSLSTMLANQNNTNTTNTTNTNNNNDTNTVADAATTAQTALLKRSGSIANLLAQGSAVV